MILTRRKALALMSALPVAATGSRPAKARPRARARITMILWRGETAVGMAFRRRLAEEGVNAEFTVRDAQMDLARIEEFVAEIKAHRPDLVYVFGTPATLAVVGPRGHAEPSRYITDIPVVFTMVSAPVEAHLVNGSLLSGRNLTGASHVVPVADQLRVMAAYRPFSRMAVVYDPSVISSIINVRELRAEAALRSITLIEGPVPLVDGRPDAKELPAVISRLAAHDPQFLYMGPDSFVGAHAGPITSMALDLRLPPFTTTESPLRQGNALFGLIARHEHVGELTARLAARILRDGEDPGRIPVQKLERFSVVVRMDVARRLVLYPPLSMLEYAELAG